MTDNQTGSAGVTVENGWMPIETAPLATPALVWLPEWNEVQVCELHEGDWYNCESHTIGAKPTHWQHLPTPPEAV